MRTTTSTYAVSLATSLAFISLVAPLTRAQSVFERPSGESMKVRRLDGDPAQIEDDPAHFQQLGGRNLCVEETFRLRIRSHHPELKGATIIFTVFSEPALVVGFDASPGGAFSDPLLFVPVKLNGAGDGVSKFFFVKGLMQGQTFVQAVSPVGDVLNPQHVTVAEVSAVTFVEQDSPLDTNTNAGGGKRIFPEKQAPTDAVNRSLVRVVANAGPPDSIVSFRSFDVDDPSSNACPVDCNGSKGNDNHGSPKVGKLSATSALIDDQGIAQVGFGVTMPPGDNFKVAASCSAAYLAGVVVDGVDLKDAEGNILPTARAKVTDMLTVWRKVHVEVDSMGAVTGNQVRGTVKSARPRTTGLASTVLTVNRLLPPGRFSPGFMRIDGLDLQLVVTNTSNQVTIFGSVTDAEVRGKSFTLFDDDDFNRDNSADGDAGANVPAPDLSLIADGLDGTCDGSAPNVFAPAYVCPVFDVGDHNDSVRFVLNTAAPTTAALIATYDFDAVGTEADKQFWTVYLLGAYQFTEKADEDPDSETSTLGAVDALNGEGASIFVETIRDVDPGPTPDACIRQIVAPHEIGHLFNGAHEDGGLMAPNAKKICDNNPSPSFSNKTLNKIRTTPHP
jgi:hypothetical protein